MGTALLLAIVPAELAPIDELEPTAALLGDTHLPFMLVPHYPFYLPTYGYSLNYPN